MSNEVNTFGLLKSYDIAHIFRFCIRNYDILNSLESIRFLDPVKTLILANKDDRVLIVPNL